MVNLRKGTLAFFLLSGLFLFGCNSQNKESEKIILNEDNQKITYLSGESKQEFSKTRSREIEQPAYQMQFQKDNLIDTGTISIKTDDVKFEEELANWRGWDYNSHFVLRIQVLDKESETTLEGVVAKIKKSNGLWTEDIITLINHKGRIYSKNFYLDSTDNAGRLIFCLRKKDLDSYIFDNSIISFRKGGYYSKDFVFLFRQFQKFIANSEPFNEEYDSSLKSEGVRFNKRKNRLRIIFNNEANEEDYRRQILHLQTGFNNRPYNYVHDQNVNVIDLEILMNPIKERTY